MLGYWKRPDEEAEVFRGEWFTGGDLGSIDDDGYIAHLGRANELMNAGGYRVSPGEIEFWQGRADRLHDRLVYRRKHDTWKIERLSP